MASRKLGVLLRSVVHSRRQRGPAIPELKLSPPPTRDSSMSSCFIPRNWPRHHSTCVRTGEPLDLAVNELSPNSDAKWPPSRSTRAVCLGMEAEVFTMFTILETASAYKYTKHWGPSASTPTTRERQAFTAGVEQSTAVSAKIRTRSGFHTILDHPYCTRLISDEDIQRADSKTMFLFKLICQVIR
ncbi:hypothetical protein B0H10DRAFT_1951376 [Mycena sp. CBHHK59/15]|nr:hypothetical protein B0H10DRAFT_1951376 [Mycena sp. CBHHK59/15]